MINSLKYIKFSYWLWVLVHKTYRPRGRATFRRRGRNSFIVKYRRARNFVFKCVARDNEGLTGSSTMAVTVIDLKGIAFMSTWYPVLHIISWWVFRLSGNANIICIPIISGRNLAPNWSIINHRMYDTSINVCVINVYTYTSCHAPIVHLMSD